MAINTLNAQLAPRRRPPSRNTAMAHEFTFRPDLAKTTIVQTFHSKTSSKGQMWKLDFHTTNGELVTKNNSGTKTLNLHRENGANAHFSFSLIFKNYDSNSWFKDSINNCMQLLSSVMPQVKNRPHRSIYLSMTFNKGIQLPVNIRAPTHTLTIGATRIATIKCNIK